MLSLHALLQQGTPTPTWADLIGGLGGSGLAGLMFYFYQQLSKRHEEDFKALLDRHNDNLRTLNDALKQVTAEREKTVVALTELSARIMQQADLKSLAEDIQQRMADMREELQREREAK